MMKPKKNHPTRKLQASARRAAPSVADDYEEEPSMKLSSAFIVVLLLHLVAVAGVYAFTRIKEHRGENVEAPFQNEQPAVPAQGNALAHSRVHAVRPGDTLIRIANIYGVEISALEKANGLHDVEVLRVGQEIRIPGASAAPAPAPKKLVSEPDEASAKSQASGSLPRDSGETYKVEKGDNPVAIARKHKVRYSDLIELNHIQDPRLLQIGQVLKLPVQRD